MKVYDYEAAFGAGDKTSRAMREAIADWFDLYYRQDTDQNRDPGQRIAYTVVNKLVKAVFSEYMLQTADPQCQVAADRLGERKEQAVQLVLVGGECYLKPVPGADGFRFALVPRDQILIFGRDPEGNPTDVGLVERSTHGRYYYTLLERRRVEETGHLIIENQLYRSYDGSSLGNPVNLWEHPAYGQLAPRYRYEEPLGGVGLVQIRTPMLNCVDGSAEGVSVYAAAVGLIRSIDENEAQLRGEFRRGESRVFLSRDLLADGQLRDHLFVGLDEAPEHVGMTVFSPQLRHEAFLARKQEYLRNLESLVGLRRGMLCDAAIDERTATEITSTAGDFNLTVMGFQTMWQQAVRRTLALCAALAKLHHLPFPEKLDFSIDWGNSTLFDEDKVWQEYCRMVEQGLLAPEVALGWRFNLPANTESERQTIRQRYMPQA